MVNNVNNYNGITTQTQVNHTDGLIGTGLTKINVIKSLNVKCLDEDQTEEKDNQIFNIKFSLDFVLITNYKSFIRKFL